MEKWIKVAIGAVIAISVIPIVVLSVFNLTQEKVKDEVLTFELLSDSKLAVGTYDSLISILISEPDESHPINVLYNSTFYNSEYQFMDFGYLTQFVINVDDDIRLMIKNNDTWGYLGPPPDPFSEGDTFEITVDVIQPPVISGVTATLLTLIPLIFITGIIYFAYQRRKI